MLRLSRQLAGITQSELAVLAGVNRSVISLIENGERKPTEDLLEKFAVETKRPVSFFNWPGEICAPSTVFHRRKASTRMREVEQTNAFINFARLKLLRMLSGMKLKTRRQIFRNPISDCRSPADIARQLRASWQVPPGPISDMTEIIESAGIVIWETDRLSTDVDGLSLWPLGEEELPPLIVLVHGKPTDRCRLTLAHELGHLIMHHMPSDHYEDDANRFAAEFLMPEDDIKQALSNMTLLKAAALKGKWKTSMQSLIRRSFDLHQISSSCYRRLMTELSMKGYRKLEPVIIRLEEPRLLQAIMTSFQSKIKDSKIASELIGEVENCTEEIRDILKLYC